MPKNRSKVAWIMGKNIGPGRKWKSKRKGLRIQLSLPRVLIALKIYYFLRYNNSIFLGNIFRSSIK